MKRKTRNAARTRQEIIEKSAPVFNVHGFSGTSMQMLVDATSFQMGGIYRHFDTKMDLAKEVFRYNYERLVLPNLVFDPEQSSKEKLVSIAANYKKMIFKPEAIGGCPILNTAVEMDDVNEDFRLLAKSFIEEILGKLEAILEAGKLSGEFYPHIDVKKEAHFLYATFEGAILLGKVMKTRNAFFDVFDNLVVYLEKCVFRD